MKLNRTFYYTNFAIDDEIYEDQFGWLDKSNEHFQATSGLGVAHDLFEHMKSEGAGLEKEARALGRMWATRMEHFHKGFYSNTDSLSNELLSLYRFILHESVELVENKRCLSYYTRYSSIRFDLLEVQKKLTQLILSEYSDDIDEGRITRKDVQCFSKTIVKYVAQGYNSALKRYKKNGLYLIGGYVFDTLVQDVNRLRGCEYGDKMKINFQIDKERQNGFYEIRHYNSYNELMFKKREDF